MNKHYLVISVKNIKALLAVAEQSRDVSRLPSDPNKDCHCITLDLESVDTHNDVSGASQISCMSLLESVRATRLSVEGRKPRGRKSAVPAPVHADWETGGSVTPEQNEARFSGASV